MSTPLPPGYRALSLLARGRRTETWDAYDEDRDVRCVVKVLRPDRAAEEHVRAAVLAEGEIVTTLVHPHLVRGYAVATDPLPAVVLETLGGATLAAVVEEAPLELPDAALLGLQLCSVLGYLHRHDWLHLDLKPANVVVEAGRAVLIDLGLARRPGPTRAGAGTPGYLAPEQARGDDVGPATDVWALGVVLLEALSGEQPFGDEATWDSRRRWPLVGRRMPSRPRPVPEGLEPAVRDLLLGCVAFHPADRPALADVRDALARA
jgi:serine/threonine protein kinase